MTCFDNNYIGVRITEINDKNASRFKKRHPWKKIGSLKKVPI